MYVPLPNHPQIFTYHYLGRFPSFKYLGRFIALQALLVIKMFV